MKITKAEGRDRRRSKSKNGMRVTGRSVFTIQETTVKRSQKIKAKRGIR